MATSVEAPTATGFANPMGTDGFEFVEYAAPDPELLRGLFTKMGFPAVAKHKRKNVTLHRQGDINFIINAEPDSFEAEFAAAHGPCACAMACANTARPSWGSTRARSCAASRAPRASRCRWLTACWS